MSALARTSASVTRSAKWFQLFQPMGGVAASSTDCAAIGSTPIDAERVEAVTVAIQNSLLRRIASGSPCPPENNTLAGRKNLF